MYTNVSKQPKSKIMKDSKNKINQNSNLQFEKTLKNLPNNVQHMDNGNGWLLWATDQNGNAIALTFISK